MIGRIRQTHKEDACGFHPLTYGYILILVCLILDNCHYAVKCKRCNQYCCSFNGSSRWSLKSVLVESMIEFDWRKALRSLWRVDHIAQCDFITAVLILNMKKVYTSYIYRFKYL